MRGIRTVEASFTLTPSLSPYRKREPNVKILFTFVLVFTSYGLKQPIIDGLVKVHLSRSERDCASTSSLSREARDRGGSRTAPTR